VKWSELRGVWALRGWRCSPLAVGYLPRKSCALVCVSVCVPLSISICLTAFVYLCKLAGAASPNYCMTCITVIITMFFKSRFCVRFSYFNGALVALIQRNQEPFSAHMTNSKNDSLLVHHKFQNPYRILKCGKIFWKTLKNLSGMASKSYFLSRESLRQEDRAGRQKVTKRNVNMLASYGHLYLSLMLIRLRDSVLLRSQRFQSKIIFLH
jgi:hypothetical protein